MIEELNYVEVTDNVTTAAIITDETSKLVRPYQTANMSCIALEKELFFVDCGSRVNLASKFRKDMEEKFGKPATHLFLTDECWDHVHGMSAYKDIKIACSSTCKSLFRKHLKGGAFVRRQEYVLNQIPENEELREAILASELVIPTIGFSRKREFGSDSNPIIARHVKGHHASSITVYVPEERVLFTGDNLDTCYPPFLWRISALDLYRSWEKLEIERVVPGHGPVVDKHYLSLIRAYLEELVEILMDLKNKGLSEKEVLESNALPEFPGKKQKSWIEGSPYHTGRLTKVIKSWYKQILREAKEEDLMFIST